MIDELIGELEDLGLKIDDVTVVQGDTLIRTDCGVTIRIFPKYLDFGPSIEFGDLTHYTAGGSVKATDIVNVVEEIKVHRNMF